MNTVFVETIGGDFSPACLHDAYRGFKYLGYTVFKFERSDLHNIPLTKETIVVGGVETVREAFTLLNVKQPNLPDIPEELRPFAFRNFWESTLGEIRKKIGEKPIFAKPLNHHKLFNGQVFLEFKDLLKTVHLPDHVQCFCSDVVNFISEYRVYIHRGEIVGVKHYKGDWREVPYDGDLFDILKPYREHQPIAYSLDVGIVNFEDTKIVSKDAYFKKSIIVELNDAFSLGNYGISYVDYACMIRDRWKEIVNA